MTNKPDCYVCGDEIEPGKARDPVIRGRKSYTRHTPSEAPDTILAQLSGADKFQMYVDDRWVEASVEVINHCERVWVAKVTENYDGMPVSFSTPSKYSGDYEIRCGRSGGDWGEIRLVELEHKWEENEDGEGEWYDPKKHDRGKVVVRPTDLTNSQIDWKFWSSRPTEPKQLWNEYWIAGKSVPEIAEEYGVSGWTVRNWMDKVGIRRRSSSEADDPLTFDIPEGPGLEESDTTDGRGEEADEREFRRRRESAGITQKAVAERAGVRQSYLSKWERGKKSASENWEEKVRSALSELENGAVTAN